MMITSWTSDFLFVLFVVGGLFDGFCSFYLFYFVLVVFKTVDLIMLTVLKIIDTDCCKLTFNLMCV